MLYTIQTEHEHGPTLGEEVTRQRRDAAALAFERKVYDVLRSCALLDRPIAHARLRCAKLAYRADCVQLEITVQSFAVRFRAA